jgi:hypothetical protein
MVMPFVSKPSVKPEKVDWGEPKGAVRHILADQSGTYAAYVLEEPPAKVTLKMKGKNSLWSHDVFLPWRYFVIRVRWDCRVSLDAPGLMYFSNSRIESADKELLRVCIFPNVWDTGNICLGYHGSLRDKSHVRVAWKTVRRVYGYLGTQWLNLYRAPIRARGLPPGCLEHVLPGRHPDTMCYMALYSQEGMLAVDWASSGRTLVTAADACLYRGDYQGAKVWNDDDVNRALKVAQVSR